jgi:hypothetical protein
LKGRFSFLEEMPRVDIKVLELLVWVDALVLVLARVVIQLVQLLVLHIIEGGAHE